MVYPIMKLQNYLTKKSMSQAEFARKLGIGRADIHRYVKGIRKPRPELANRIVEFTEHAVTLEDLYADA